MGKKMIGFLDKDGEPAGFSTIPGGPGRGKSFIYYGGTGGGKTQFALNLKMQFPDHVTILQHEQSSKSIKNAGAGAADLNKKYGVQKAKELITNINNLATPQTAGFVPVDDSEFFMLENIASALLSEELFVKLSSTINQAIHILSLCSGVSLKSSELASLIDPNSELYLSLLKNGAHDKTVIDLLLNCLSEFLLGRSWPVFTNRNHFKVFFHSLHRAAEAHGYKVRVKL